METRSSEGFRASVMQAADRLGENWTPFASSLVFLATWDSGDYTPGKWTLPDVLGLPFNVVDRFELQGLTPSGVVVAAIRRHGGEIRRLVAERAGLEHELLALESTAEWARRSAEEIRRIEVVAENVEGEFQAGVVLARVRLAVRNPLPMTISRIDFALETRAVPGGPALSRSRELLAATLPPGGQTTHNILVGGLSSQRLPAGFAIKDLIISAEVTGAVDEGGQSLAEAAPAELPRQLTDARGRMAELDQRLAFLRNSANFPFLGETGR